MLTKYFVISGKNQHK